MKYKRLFSALLVFSICCSFCESAFALSNSTIAHEDDSDGYNFYTIDFDDNDGVVNLHDSEVAVNSRVSQAKVFVKSLELENKGFIGLEDAIISELDTLAVNDVQLGSYSVALPRATEYYGHYDGFMFQAAYTYRTEKYDDELTGKSQHEQFLEGLVNIVMSVPGIPTVISLPFSLLSYAGHPIITNTAVTQLTNRDEITTRYIMIQDLNKQASLNPNTFVPVIMDEVRVSRTTVITFPNGPYASVKIEGESDLNEFPSKYFYDKNHNLSSGYNHYIAGNISDPITNLVPTVKFSWG